MIHGAPMGATTQHPAATTHQTSLGNTAAATRERCLSTWAMVEPLLKELASQRHGSAAGGDTARLGLYQAIIDMGKAGEEEAETSTSTAFERQKGAILPVLVKGIMCRLQGQNSFGWPCCARLPCLVRLENLRVRGRQGAKQQYRNLCQ